MCTHKLSLSSTFHTTVYFEYTSANCMVTGSQKCENESCIFPKKIWFNKGGERENCVKLIFALSIPVWLRHSMTVSDCSDHYPWYKHDPNNLFRTLTAFAVTRLVNYGWAHRKMSILSVLLLSRWAYQNITVTSPSSWACRPWRKSTIRKLRQQVLAMTQLAVPSHWASPQKL